LGLAIARRAVEAHGGSISAQNSDHGGLAVRILVPLRENSLQIKAFETAIT
jgi:two-component system, OmpR family, sensor kinase